ncbi:hypothetical protein [Mesorhizobium sp.]|uniref:hypothetical protein n=1 Tax=Mesorhizobium sp. TaxID=1871066 RepID=UPI000FE48CC1|nr:hypothetical protein [Mesorhizobium sp.]RWN60263.1 MAG: hypothetical protein EOS00_17105 [Mesorhizobium sp.]
MREVDAYKAACERAGVCMTCVIQAPEPYGCSDCLNTGWSEGDPYERIKQLEAPTIGELGPDGKEWAKTVAGFQHVDSVKHQAFQGSSPIGGTVWHGHAIREAFVAGAEWQEQRKRNG